VPPGEASVFQRAKFRLASENAGLLRLGTRDPEAEIPKSDADQPFNGAAGIRFPRKDSSGRANPDFGFHHVNSQETSGGAPSASSVILDFACVTSQRAPV
jgi:hypothetical protein